MSQCLEASLKVANFTDDEVAALASTQRKICEQIRSTIDSVEEEIGSETLTLFNFHDPKSFVSMYSAYLYNAENNRYTYVNNGKALKPLNPELGSSLPGTENDVGSIKVIEKYGRTDTNAHKAYNNLKTRLQNALSEHQYVTTAQIKELSSYVSSKYQAESLWDFLKERGFSYNTPSNNINILVTETTIKEWEKTNSSNKWGEYNKDLNEGYTGLVYNNKSFNSEDVLLYVLNHRKVQDSLYYQGIVYEHYYKTYIPDNIKSTPIRIFYFDEPVFKNTSEFSFDAATNSVTVNSKAAGATGCQSVKVQYRADSDDAWTTSYAPTLTITLKDGFDYEFRTVISDEAGHKETTETQYFSAVKLVEEKRPYIDSNGDYKLGTVKHYEYNGKNYAVNEDGSMGEELSNVSISDFEFASLGNGYQINYYIGSYDNIPDSGLVIPKTYQGKAISVIGSGTLEKSFMEKATGDKKQFVIILNENINKISDYAFYAVWVTTVTGNTSGLNKIGKYAFSWANNPGGNTLDIKLDNKYIYMELQPFNKMNVTFRIKYGTYFTRNNIGGKSKTYIFTDGHKYDDPVWQWSDDHSSAKATFTCGDSRCNHKETVKATVTNIGNNGISYKATVKFNGQTYTGTYTASHTHTYGEPVWTWSEDHTKATATFPC